MESTSTAAGEDVKEDKWTDHPPEYLLAANACDDQLPFLEFWGMRARIGQATLDHCGAQRTMKRSSCSGCNCAGCHGLAGRNLGPALQGIAERL